MKLVDEIGSAIMREKQRLARMRSPLPVGPGAMAEVELAQPLFGRLDVIDHILRVEVEPNIAWDLERYAFTTGSYDQSKRRPALKLAGVSVYSVEHELPSCGWRIVNPFDARA